MRLIGKISSAAMVIGILVVIWLVFSGIRGCQKTVREIIAPVSGQEDPEWGKPRDVEVKPRLFGQEEKPTLEIVIPPSEDTTRLRIPGGERIYGLPEDAEFYVVKYPPPIIRLKPSLHLCGLSESSEVYFGVKIRFLEVWRFGLCGYLATCGPGIGCDFQVISNISIGVMKSPDDWYGEVSIKL